MKKSIAMILVALGGVAQAAPQAVPVGQSGVMGKDEKPHAVTKTPADVLAELEAARAVAKARAEVATQEAAAAAASKSGSAQAMAPIDTPPPAPRSKPRIAEPVAEAPTVVQLAGVAGKFTAMVMANGMRHSIAPGDMLPGGWLVSKIDSAGVMFIHAGQPVTLRP